MRTESRHGVEVVVMPLRFTDHVPAMRDFLTLLGFSSRVSRDESWVDMVGGSGMVALHSTSTTSRHPAETGLSFEVPDADALAAQFTAAGLADVAVYDEAYGRALDVTGHDGTRLTFGERATDLYGYRHDEPRPEHGIVSMPLWFGPPAGPYDDLLAAAGFVRLDEGDDQWWRAWRSTGGGLVALHPATEHRAAGSVELGFRTEEPLPELADRLTAAGYTGVSLSDDFGGELTVSDPDGATILVQPLPAG